MKTDILIIGAGVTGAAIAYRLCRYRLDIVWVEKENDVCMGSSKANSSMVHDGYNVDGHKLKGKLVLKSHPLYRRLCQDLFVPHNENAGSIVVGFKDEDIRTINEQMAMGVENGIGGLRIVNRDQLLELEPNLNPEAKFGLYNPNTGVLDPFQLTAAMAENAVMNGVKFFRNTEVTAINVQEGKIQSVETTRGAFQPKVVINAAGIYSDKIAAMVEEIDWTIRPRKGQYFLYDREWNGHVRHCIYSSPTKISKGMIIVPTTEGNILAGSNSLSMEDKEDKSTTLEEMEDIYRELIYRHFPKLPRRESVVTAFTGLRAVSDTEDFIIARAKTVRGFINVAGIQSPGLSSSPAIAEMVEELTRDSGEALDFTEREDHREGRPKPVFFRDMTNEDRNKLIQQDSDFGTVICRCETVTRGEILNALRGPVPAMDMDGVKRRVRAGMGRCQGGFCGPRVMALLRRELGVSALELTKKGKESRVLTGQTKDPSLLTGEYRGEKVKL
ncbi:MAG: NAD(P)/FAD-dependent oxidoreductase [Treponema sp.]|jgi:glycerol-3-phosphate dehydrogenase|nr:NAD(P)/FAD-dependent oxidoreductase [Treponema sp.]